MRSVATIVNQVQAMKQLVNEFRDYARLPAAQLKPLDLNALVAEVLALYGQRAGAGPPAAPSWRQGLPRDRGRRHAAAPGDPQPGAERAGRGGRPARRPACGCAPRPRAASSGELRAVRLTVIDNGPGFADKVLKRAFEPYVTTKTKGTGLGLAVVKKIADEHGARVRIANLRDAAAADAADGPVRGAQSFVIIFNSFATAPRPGRGRTAATTTQAH